MAVKIAAGATAMVALASAVLSWDALQWGAAQLGVDSRLTWLYPVAVDGVIVVGTAAALALRSARRRVRAYVWIVLSAAITTSVVGNAAHASGSSWLHRAGAAVPAAALAASLHLVVILVRSSVQAAPVAARSPRSAAAPARSRRRERPVVLPDGRQVAASTARRLKARRLAVAGGITE